MSWFEELRVELKEIHSMTSVHRRSYAEALALIRNRSSVGLALMPKEDPMMELLDWLEGKVAWCEHVLSDEEASQDKETRIAAKLAKADYEETIRYISDKFGLISRAEKARIDRRAQGETWDGCQPDSMR